MLWFVTVCNKTVDITLTGRNVSQQMLGYSVNLEGLEKVTSLLGLQQ